MKMEFDGKVAIVTGATMPMDERRFRRFAAVLFLLAVLHRRPPASTPQLPKEP
jgi:hypothetical protein